MSNRRDYNNNYIDPSSNSGAGNLLLIFFVIIAFIAIAGASSWASFGIFYWLFFILICPALFGTGYRRHYATRHSSIPSSSVKLEDGADHTYRRVSTPKIITQQFCSNCGSLYESNDTFCSSCGARLE